MSYYHDGRNCEWISGVATAEAKMAGKGAVDAAAAGAEAVVASPKTSGSPSLSKLCSGNLLEKFTVDNSTYSQVQIRATFYPKFENEKSDQEIRIRMIEMVAKGLSTLEVSLKHSGSLFMYAGHEGGAYAKNSFGNIYCCWCICTWADVSRGLGSCGF